MPRPRKKRYQDPTESTIEIRAIAEVVPAAEGVGGPEEQDRPGDRPAEPVDEQGVGDERADEQADGAPVAAVAEVDVLAALGLTPPTAEQVDGEQDGHQDQQQPDRRSGRCGR